MSFSDYLQAMIDDAAEAIRAVSPIDKDAMYQMLQQRGHNNAQAVVAFLTLGGSIRWDGSIVHWCERQD